MKAFFINARLNFGMILLNMLMPYTCIKFKSFVMKRIVGLKVGKDVTFVGGHTYFYSPNVSIGDSSWIGTDNRFYFPHYPYEKDAYLKIGSNVALGPNVTMCSGTHEYGPPERRAGKDVQKPIIIEDGVWICMNSVILGGVTVGKGSVVAANSVVGKDVAPNTLVGGSPAKFIKDLSV